MWSPRARAAAALVLIQEIFGVNAHIRETCDSYADDGYEVLSPALYDREAPGFETGYAPEDIQKAIKIARGEHPVRAFGEGRAHLHRRAQRKG